MCKQNTIFEQYLKNMKLRGPHRLSMGIGIGQFGELFQGQVQRHSTLHRCLVSLPCPELISCATYNAAPFCSLHVHPKDKEKARTAALLALKYYHDDQEWGGTIEITSNITAAKGCGSSTADCIAAVLAV